ncbi:hypothetical protein J4D97_20965 [Hymenobacter defluvii]|uniref:Transposase IS701-like DDE domain-containing protein n=1 Tax=Hymenobacter defluvii TaxID=2054411 RepID=A0ABS3TK85_9BACT|nr:hypothetical protein [Hymenobacter defluvii]MBO3273135.1 hypothetical protein [Hymenobacter defluvii]
MKVTAQLYGQFLLSSQVTYTGTYLAEYLASLRYDNVQYFLKTRCFSQSQLWQQVWGEFVVSARGYVLFDDTVLDKSHSHKIELVRRQYSGNAHGIIPGIGLVSCVYVNPDTDNSGCSTTACSPSTSTVKTSTSTWWTCSRSCACAKCPTAPCSWTDGTPPRPYSSGSSKKRSCFTVT